VNRLTPRLDRVFIYTCNGKYSQKDIRRFLKYIRINKETGCWEWIGYLSSRGYGQFTISKNGKCFTYRAHRIAIEMATGILIIEGMCVCHHCDNPKCVNVLACLFLGTYADNNHDRDNKNRQIAKGGEEHYRSKFTWKDVTEVRHKYNYENNTINELSLMFKVKRNVIENIVNNKTWHDPNYIKTIYKIGNRKINHKIADKIRILYATGKYTQKQLGIMFGISSSTVRQILNNETWKSLPRR